MKFAIATIVGLLLTGALLACNPYPVEETPEATATPTFSPVGETYTTDQSVTISCGTSGSAIYYTFDGSTPTTSSTQYSSPIAVAGDGTAMTIKAVAISAATPPSSIAISSYMIAYSATATPTTSMTQYSELTVRGNGRGTVTPSDTVTVERGVPTLVRAFPDTGFLFIRWLAVSGSGVVLGDPICADTTVSLSSGDGTIQADFQEWASLGSWGSGVGQFSGPQSIATDSKNRIYVSDSTNCRIVRMNDIYGSEWTVFGRMGRGEGELTCPWGIAIDSSDRIYISDRGNNRIVRIDDMTGAGWMTLGSFGNGEAQFGEPTDIAVDGNGRIYVADMYFRRVVSMDDISGAGWVSFGDRSPNHPYPSDQGEFREPHGIAVDSKGRIFIADTYGSCIVRIDDMTGSNRTEFGSIGQDEGQFWNEEDVFIDSFDRIYSADRANNRIIRIDGISGDGWIAIGSKGSGDLQFQNPVAVTADSDGRIYVVDCGSPPGGSPRVVQTTLP